MKLETEITINESPEKVWKILIDFSSFKKWNSFLVRIFGSCKKEGHLIVMARFPKFIFRYVPIVFHCQISELKENKELRWKGKFLHSFFFLGEHYFILESSGDSAKEVRLVHGEKYSGILSFIILPLISSKEGFETMNLQLKERSES